MDTHAERYINILGLYCLYYRVDVASHILVQSSMAQVHLLADMRRRKLKPDMSPCFITAGLADVGSSGYLSASK